MAVVFEENYQCLTEKLIQSAGKPTVPNLIGGFEGFRRIGGAAGEWGSYEEGQWQKCELLPSLNT